MPQTLSPLDVLNSSGKYPEREQSDECTSQVRANAADLAERVSKLLDALYTTATVSSGFRTQAANKSAKGATKSAHMTGEACDLSDPKKHLAGLLLANLELLDKYDLYMEDLAHTVGWVHLQTRKTKSGKRVFIP